jgi:hypothetical protein
MLPNLTGLIVTAQPNDSSLPLALYICLAHAEDTLFLVSTQGGIYSGIVTEAPLADGQGFGWNVLSYHEDDLLIGGVIDSLTNILVAPNLTLTKNGRLSARITREALVACFREKRAATLKAVREGEDAARAAERAGEDQRIAEFYDKLAENPNPDAEKEVVPYTEQAYGSTDAPAHITIAVRSDDPAVAKRTIEQIRAQLRRRNEEL